MTFEMLMNSTTPLSEHRVRPAVGAFRETDIVGSIKRLAHSDQGTRLLVSFGFAEQWYKLDELVWL